jgi:hypothetical protein
MDIRLFRSERAWIVIAALAGFCFGGLLESHVLAAQRVKSRAAGIKRIVGAWRPGTLVNSKH